MNNEDHPAFKRTWWMNLYPDGQCTGALCETRDSALNRCTYTGDKPDAVQVEVRIVPAAAGEPPQPDRDGLYKSQDDSTIEDGFGSVWSAWCCMCGRKSMHVCRPGKAQCGYCG